MEEKLSEAELLQQLAERRQARAQELADIIERESKRLRCEVIGVPFITDGRIAARVQIIAKKYPAG